MKLCDIKGLGEKRIAKLAECGIYDPIDLLMLFPYAYFDRNNRVDWDKTASGEDVIFRGTPVGRPLIKHVRRGLSFVKAAFVSEGRTITCTWFNQDYVFGRICSGERFLIAGKVKRIGKNIEIVAPQILPERDTDVMPLYKLPKGITQSVMSDAVRTILSRVDVKGYVSAELAHKYGLMPLSDAFRAVHLPYDTAETSVARRSIAMENLAYTLSVYNIAKGNGVDTRKKRYSADVNKIYVAMDELPFTLTKGQSDAVKEILDELHSTHRMNVLLQGDVGSGKTIVAFLAMYYAVLSGYQCAVMAPTEILAAQHYEKAVRFFGEKGIKVSLLTGSMKSAERNSVKSDISSGATGITIGTHAVIGADVAYKNLGLTVVDEQHRFGVCQRGSLENKADGADNIVMSATPIPRTLALTLYGQLKSIELRMRPGGRNNIMTAIVPERKLGNMYEYIKNKAAIGENTYIVCPRVDSDDTVSAVGLYNELKCGALAGVGVGLLHGRQKESEKAAAMRDFSTGKTRVLVSTTVIEVGIDVRQATTMVIFGAEYFGLGQLHQLRGRVGRDGRASYCFLVSDEPSERIKFLCETSDGFELAEYDFNMRGAGDFLGTRQHGNSAAAGVRIDADMIAKAKSISDELLSDRSVRDALAVGAEEKSEFIRSLSLN